MTPFCSQFSSLDRKSDIGQAHLHLVSKDGTYIDQSDSQFRKNERRWGRYLSLSCLFWGPQQKATDQFGAVYEPVITAESRMNAANSVSNWLRVYETPSLISGIESLRA